MSHGITKFDQIVGVEKFWHGLNTVVEKVEFDGGPIDWEVHEEPVFDADMNPIHSLVEKQGEFEERPYKRLVTKFEETNGSVTPITLHVAQDSYEIIQNRKLFEASRILLDEYGFRIVSMGSILGRKRVFFTLESDDSTFNVGDDKNILRISVISSHNGSAKASFIETAFRVVCNNTFQAAYNQLEGFRKAQLRGDEIGKFFDFVKHTKNADVKLQEVKQGMIGYVQRKEVIAEELTGLSQTKITESDASDFALGIVGMSSDSISTRGLNQAGEIFGLFKGGIGNSGSSRYDLLNGVTEFYTHNAASDPDRMFVSSEFGTYANRKKEAFIRLTSEEMFQKTCQHGSKLLDAVTN